MKLLNGLIKMEISDYMEAVQVMVGQVIYGNTIRLQTNGHG